MNAYPKEAARAAKWLWDRKHRSADWDWKDLSASNPDTESLGYSNVMSFQIFGILEKKGLISPFVFTKDGVTHSVFKLELDDSRKWEEAQKIPTWWRRYLMEPAIEVFTGIGRFIFWALSILATGILTKLID